MNKELFHQIYVDHYRQVFAYLYGRTNNKEVAADLLQDLFLRVWNRMETVERIPTQQRLYWLFSIASNQLKDYYRKSSTQQKTEEQLRSQYHRPTGDLSNLLEGQEQFRELEAAINTLPEELRCILVMKVIGEMNSFQIGHALQIPAGTIRYKMAKARRLLAEQLGMFTEDTAQERRKPNG
ncbi:RNA polymerase sigma factor [Paenibacillus terrigena]|uniref:RNA polymerase sigma factor n=1 Tax=Paenibacillus terrigena TaxID=369333 RepID=UPI000378C84B|nr:RNA polymerase sigma factor [Paenibacillus terrigena]